MDPVNLLGSSNSLGFPAPYWFLILFKVIGFCLHMIFMNIFYVGILAAMLLYSIAGSNGKLLAAKVMRLMPIIIAYGVNFGIVPLLFMQVAYYKVFYPATILMAWPWLSIIALLTIAYYGVYIYAIGLKSVPPALNTFRKISGWISAVFFLLIGFFFANAMSLMTNLNSWENIWHFTSVAGAPLGIALNIDDPTIWPRWLLMIGLALMTFSAYVIFNTFYFSRAESHEYKKWIVKLSSILFLLGSIWSALAGSWYVFGTWSPELRTYMLGGTISIMTYLTAISPIIPLIFILHAWRIKSISKVNCLLICSGQVVVIILNAISRQIVQNYELGRFLDISSERVNTQWSPMILFLILFLAGMGLIYWMLRQVVISSQRETT